MTLRNQSSNKNCSITFFPSIQRNSISTIYDSFQSCFSENYLINRISNWWNQLNYSSRQLFVDLWNQIYKSELLSFPVGMSATCSVPLLCSYLQIFFRVTYTCYHCCLSAIILLTKSTDNIPSEIIWFSIYLLDSISLVFARFTTSAFHLLHVFFWE